MQQEHNHTQVSEFTKEIESGVKFDPDAVSLLGIYKDELSLFRAKRSWTEILESNFLLEAKYDYIFDKLNNPESGAFILQCSFLTACGRYAFWRLTNHQAPEAQYLIETAHIPNSELASDMYITAPDLSPIISSKPDLELYPELEQNLNKTLNIIQEIKEKLVNLTKKLIPHR